MPRQNSPRQMAAHLTQSYMENSKDAETVWNFSTSLEARVRMLRKEKSECYQDMGSLLYCVRDMRSSCRDTAALIKEGSAKEAGKTLDRAALRVREICQLLADIRHNHPEEYDRSCKVFVSDWGDMKFDRGSEVINKVASTSSIKALKDAGSAAALKDAPKEVQIIKGPTPPAGPVL